MHHQDFELGTFITTPIQYKQHKYNHSNSPKHSKNFNKIIVALRNYISKNPECTLFKNAAVSRLIS